MTARRRLKVLSPHRQSKKLTIRLDVCHGNGQCHLSGPRYNHNMLGCHSEDNSSAGRIATYVNLCQKLDEGLRDMLYRDRDNGLYTFSIIFL